MKRILAPILLLTLLFPALALSETMGALVKTDGLYYKKFSDVPFTGKVTGNEQGSFKDGKEDGPWVYSQDNGQLVSKGTYKDGKRDGPWVTYWDNGQLRAKGTYKDEKRDGPWVTYWFNGQLRTKGTYKDGKRDGPWIRYWDNGTVWSALTGTYKNGVRVK